MQSVIVVTLVAADMGLLSRPQSGKEVSLNDVALGKHGSGLHSYSLPAEEYIPRRTEKSSKNWCVYCT